MASYDAFYNATTSAIPRCSFEVGGLCYEHPKSNKGYVVYDDFRTCTDSFINLPGINLLPTWLLAVMWGIFLLYLFFGVAVISDAFVEGIEVITDTTHQVKRMDQHGRPVWREEPVWNWAVANITLLALGSSSPEILLALIETLLTLGQPAGEIGPSCIVGSSAYNLFGIIAVCTVSLPYGTFKKIEHLKVFAWTATWSMWVHIWLWLVYKRITPNVIDIWEAWLTLAFFPMFVYTTWLVDTRGFNWFGKHKNAIVHCDDVVEGDAESGVEHIGNGSSKMPAGSASMGRSAEAEKHHSILYYRSMAVQKMAGAGLKEAAQAENQNAIAAKEASGRFTLDDMYVDLMGKEVTKIMMKSPEVSVLESAGEARLQVLRQHGDMDSTVTVDYCCKDDTAVASLDYIAQEGTLTLGPGEEVKEIVIKIVDDDMSEPDVFFTVELTACKAEGAAEVVILRNKVVVTIVDDDDGGIAMFELPTWEAGAQDSFAQVVVVRRNGADGRVTVDWATKDGSAMAGKHYRDMSSTLVFNSGETRKVIEVPMLPFVAPELASGLLAFRLTLTNPTGGLVLGTRKECRVVVTPGTKIGKALISGEQGLEVEEEEYNLWVEWENRFKEAILPVYDEDEGNVWLCMLLHYINFTFKLFASCIPPPKYKGGYPCFLASLAVLVALMAVVKEVAEQFGCNLGLSDLMTGMSVVALGTSLPDTFGSRYAAMKDSNADAAIGNVTGSNTVNVLLGLGLPWVIATAYYKAKHVPYVVPAGALGFSILIFSILAVVGISALMVRRRQGGELGGSKAGQLGMFAFLMSLWLGFLLISGLYDYGHIPKTSF